MKRRMRSGVVLVLAIVIAASPSAFAQTQIKLPKNKYTPAQDVQLGKEAAAEVREQYPVIKDERINRYLTTLGDRLVAAAPADLKQSVYEYSFTPVNLKEINAFALPGGPMFVNRGMFEAAASEGEVVGVMAHELSHVLLRHGTANATKAQNPWLQLGQIAGAIGGAVVGGAAGSAIAQGSQFGLGHAPPAIQPRVREAGRSARVRRSWRAPGTIRARSRTCSRPSRQSSRTAAARRSG